MSARFAACTAMLALSAGAAQAQPALLSLDPSVAKASTAQFSPLDLSVRGGAGFTDAQAEALRSGVAKTSVDQRFSQRLSASIGFLCDPHDALQYDRATAMPGADPQGKFLGAKLSFAFR